MRARQVHGDEQKRMLARLPADVRELFHMASQESMIDPADVLSGSREPHIVNARRAIVRVLATRGWSQIAIGKAINRDRRSVANLIERRKT